jgi:hypothetical protein
MGIKAAAERRLRARIAELEARLADRTESFLKRIAELETDFHRIAEAVLGDIHEGEATADDVIGFVKATDAQYGELQDVVAAHTSESYCQTCGTPLSRDCPKCRRLWET